MATTRSRTTSWAARAAASTWGRSSAPWACCASAPLWNQIDASVDVGDPVLPNGPAALGRWARVDRHRPARPRLVRSRRLRRRRLVLRRDDGARLRRELPASRRRSAKLRPVVGSAHHEPLRSRAAPISARGCRPTNRSRWADPCGCRDSASTSSRAANTPSVGRCTTTGSSRCRTSWAPACTSGASAEVGRITDRYDGLPSPGDAVFGIGVPGGRHLRRTGVPGRRVRQRRELQRLPAARRAVNTRDSGCGRAIRQREGSDGKQGLRRRRRDDPVRQARRERAVQRHGGGGRARRARRRRPRLRRHAAGLSSATSTATRPAGSGRSTKSG